MQIKTAKIFKNNKISEDTCLLEFSYNMKILPTQFIMIDTYPYRFLLKPFSIADFEKGICKIIYRIISDGTKFLSTKKPEEEIKFLGPFGNTEKLKSLEINKDDKIILLAGGSGVASIIFLYKYLSKFASGIRIFYGEKEKKYIINLSKFDIKNENVVYTTDDGSFGEKGFVTEVFYKNFKNLKIDYLFVCGPKEMIKSTQKILKYKNIKSFVLLEEYMCCGVGVCKSCVVKVKGKNGWVYQPVCKEGPMFELKDLFL